MIDMQESLVMQKRITFLNGNLAYKVMEFPNLKNRYSEIENSGSGHILNLGNLNKAMQFVL